MVTNIDNFLDVHIRYILNDPTVAIKSNVDDNAFVYRIQNMRLEVTKVNDLS